MQRIDFNESWEFFNGKDTMIVNLPHDAMLYENRDRTNPSSGAGVYFGGNRYSYRKKFQINDCEEKNLILQCEGIYQNASVLVNGNQAAQRPYGYVNFYTDLTPYLCEGENEIEIIADNADTPNARYYSGAGIYREVHLLTAGNSYITPEGIKITTKSQDAIRSSHNPISKAFLDACDEYGLYVMDETWDYWLICKNPYDQANESFKSWWKRDVDSMIGIDFNHPSVIMYSIGNEISELGTQEGQTLCAQIAGYVKEKDATRAVTCGINLMPTSAIYNVMMNKMGGIVDKTAATKGAYCSARRI